MSKQLVNVRRSRALFQSLSTDFLLREQFVTDPAGLLADYVDGKPLDPETGAAANQLLYAVVSNPGLLAWLREPKGPDGFELSDFVAAIAEHGDEPVIASLIASGMGEMRSVVPALEVVRRIAISIAGAGRPVGSGTEMTPGTGTQMTPGTGTNVSPGRIVSGTEMTPGTGTQMTPGTGTNVSPAGQLKWREFETPLRALVEFAVDLRRAGVLSRTGLEGR